MTWEGLNPPYATIVADPPWKYGTGKFDTSGAERTKTSAALRYSTMTALDIAGMPVGELAAESCHLWLWGTNMKLRLAYEAVEAWGFEPVTLVTWCKPGPGVGHYLRNNTEHAVFGVRGKPMPPEVKPLSSWFQWSRTAHSAKPAAFYDLVEQVSPGPYVELFARQPRLGWDSWGFGYEGVNRSGPDGASSCDSGELSDPPLPARSNPDQVGEPG